MVRLQEGDQDPALLPFRDAPAAPRLGGGRSRRETADVRRRDHRDPAHQHAAQRPRRRHHQQRGEPDTQGRAGRHPGAPGTEHQRHEGHGREQRDGQHPDRKAAGPVFREHRKRGRVDVDLPQGGDQQGARQQHRGRAARPVARPGAGHAHRGERGERGSERREVVEVEDAARVAVDRRVGERPAGPQQAAQARRRQGRPRPAREQARHADQRQRQQPLGLGREQPIGQSSRSHRRAHEEPGVAFGRRGDRRSGGGARRPGRRLPHPRRLPEPHEPADPVVADGQVDHGVVRAAAHERPARGGRQIVGDHPG